MWQWPLVTDEIGCVGRLAGVSVDDTHYFMGTSDFYAFNGAYPQPIGGLIKDFFFQDELDHTNASKTIAIHNKKQGLVYFFYYSSQSTASTIDKYIAFHIRSARWGPPTAISIEMAFEYIAPGITYDTLGNFYSTYDDLPAIPYDDLFWSAIFRKTGIFTTAGRLQTLDQPATSSSLTLFDIGSEEGFSFIKRARPRFKIPPTSAKLINSYQENAGGTWVSDSPTATLVDGKFDFERESRWHSLRMLFTGEMEIIGSDIVIQEAGSE